VTDAGVSGWEVVTDEVTTTKKAGCWHAAQMTTNIALSVDNSVTTFGCVVFDL